MEPGEKIEALAEFLGYEPRGLIVQRWDSDDAEWGFYYSTYSIAEALHEARENIKRHWRIWRESDGVIIAQATS